MPDDSLPPAQWSTSAWREEATRWLDRELAGVGSERIGEVTQPHLEPWSTVLSAETTQGKVWLKAMAPGTSFEIGIYEVLVRLDPEHVLHPIASHPDRGWLLLPDGGRSLAERLTGDELVEAMVTALPQYAALQRATMDLAETLLRIGVTDMRTEHLPHLYRTALGASRGGPVSDELLGLEADFMTWCEIVGESPLPPTLDHNDLHPWNILGMGSTPGGNPERAVFYDWGDSVLAHPLGSAEVPISRVRRMLGLGPRHPHLSRMRDAYLEIFTDLLPLSRLRELFGVSCRLAKAARAVIWDRSPQDIARYLSDVARDDPAPGG